MIKFRLGEHGQVQEPFLHDGYMTGIKLEGKTTHVFLETTSGEAYKLTLHEVREFIANNVLTGNIIFDLWIVSGSKLADDHDFGNLLEPPHSSAARAYHDAYATRRKQVTQEIETGELTLCWMDASYGATFDAICGSVSLKPSN
jgi:hypothetical protein